MERREFLKIAGLGGSALMVPVIGRAVSVLDTAAPLDFSAKKMLADVALNAASKAGASYVDVRIGRYLRQYVMTRETRVENVVNTESFGVGIRVIANGTWGFAAVSTVTPEAIAAAAREAVAIAKANSRLTDEPVQLAPVKGAGDVKWRTPIEINGFEIPIKDKIELLLAANNAALKNGAKFINNNLFLVNEQKFFASTDGSYIDQDVHRVWPTFTVTAVDEATGKFKTRNSFSDPKGMGYEYLVPLASEKIAGPTTLYRNRYDMVEDAAAAAKQVKEKLKAKSVKPGKYDLVLDPGHLSLTIHESVGHPLELDRVLGYEANYAGTSFATLEKRGKFQYGSDLVNIVADKTQPTGLGTVPYDDEGVKTKRWDLIKNGVLVNYQAIRDQVHILGEKESHGCCYADSWSSVQFQRMPNVSLQPGKKPYSVNDMIKDVENGIYIIGRGSYSIDQQRYNAQFGGQLFYEIKNGKVAGMLDDVAYQIRTPEFWNSCAALCDENDYRLGGSFFDGKGQPGQVSAVSHGCPTTRFNGVNVINTGRKL